MTIITVVFSEEQFWQRQGNPRLSLGLRHLLFTRYCQTVKHAIKRAYPGAKVTVTFADESECGVLSKTDDPDVIVDNIHHIAESTLAEGVWAKTAWGELCV